MNLKSVEREKLQKVKYLENEKSFLDEKITHMSRRWGTPQIFFLAFTDELEKQIII